MLSQIDGLIILVTHVPKQRKHKNFYKNKYNSDNYPVLIHCYHGTGRAEMYSALYRSMRSLLMKPHVKSENTIENFDDTPKGEYQGIQIKKRIKVQNQ
jgi:protein tyrosine/serine phosphatase